MSPGIGSPAYTAAGILYGIAAVLGLVSSGFPLIAPFFGVLGIVAIIIAYVRRGETAGTWLASHYRWLIRTFWFSMLWAALGWLVLVTLGTWAFLARSSSFSASAVMPLVNSASAAKTPGGSVEVLIGDGWPY